MKISIVTAVFNAASTIEQALQSVADQVDVDIEHVVVDGASSDGTVELLSAHRASIGKFLSEPDQGIYDALNKGIALATGEVVGFLHSDDYFAHDRVIAQIASAFSDPRVDVVYGDLDYVRKDNPGRVLRHWVSGRFSRSALAKGWMPPHPTMYVRRDLYLRLGGFDTSYRIAADYECILRILGERDTTVCYLPEVLVKMRTGGASNRSLRNIVLKSREDYRAIRQHGIGGSLTLLQKNFSKVSQFFRR
jgi:glycosyltransferase involved in cell wall biosynthesis